MEHCLVEKRTISYFYALQEVRFMAEECQWGYNGSSSQRAPSMFLRRNAISSHLLLSQGQKSLYQAILKYTSRETNPHLFNQTSNTSIHMKMWESRKPPKKE